MSRRAINPGRCSWYCYPFTVFALSGGLDKSTWGINTMSSPIDKVTRVLATNTRNTTYIQYTHRSGRPTGAKLPVSEHWDGVQLRSDCMAWHAWPDGNNKPCCSGPPGTGPGTLHEKLPDFHYYRGGNSPNLIRSNETKWRHLIKVYPVFTRLPPTGKLMYADEAQSVKAQP